MPTFGNELIDELLVVADELASVPVDRVSLQEARRRRALSAAYYAVFHALASLCVDSLVGWSADAATIDHVYRALDHRSTRDKLRQRAVADLHPDLASIGTAFAQFLEKRELADYGFCRVTLAADTIEQISIARDAVETIARFDPLTRQRLAALLVVRPRTVPR